jgi:RNA polymerase sigma factor (TIGR02999 family)
MSEVSRNPGTLADSDPNAASQLFPLIYSELRRLADQRLSREAPDQTLQPTALVHEAYLRLVSESADQRWDNRGHFFAAAAEAMRRILVERARRKRAVKHGGDRDRVGLDESLLAAPEPREDLITLDEALTKLAAADGQAAELVQLRYFGGFPLPEIAQILGISPLGHPPAGYARQ